MNYEEEIKKLNARVEKLEKAEKKRQITKWIKLSIDLIGLIVLIILFIKAYSFLKDYKEQLDKVQTIEDQLNLSGDYLQEQLDNINKYNLFK